MPRLVDLSTVAKGESRLAASSLEPRSRYVWTAEGWLYVAAVVDLFSRRVVGWSMNTPMTAQLVTDALGWRSGDTPRLVDLFTAAKGKGGSTVHARR